MGNVCNLRFVFFVFIYAQFCFFSSAQRISTSVSAQNVIPPSASFQAGLVCILFTQHDAINLKKKKKKFGQCKHRCGAVLSLQTEEQALQRALEMSLADSRQTVAPALR